MAQSWVSEGFPPPWAGEAPAEAGQGHQSLRSISCIQPREETNTRICSMAVLNQQLLQHGSACVHLAAVLAPESRKRGWNKASESINQLPWYISSLFLTYFEINKKNWRQKKTTKIRGFYRPVLEKNNKVLWFVGGWQKRVFLWCIWVSGMCMCDQTVLHWQASLLHS